MSLNAWLQDLKIIRKLRFSHNVYFKFSRTENTISCAFLLDKTPHIVVSLALEDLGTINRI